MLKYARSTVGVVKGENGTRLSDRLSTRTDSPCSVLHDGNVASSAAKTSNLEPRELVPWIVKVRPIDRTWYEASS
jgi:hypothetical protein